MADAGVALTVLPATDLFMTGRDRDYSVIRGVADVNFFVEHGVNCSLSTNNVLNPFTPFGDGSLLRMANLQANVAQVGAREQLRACFAMLTDRSARLMNLPDYGVRVGNPADLVVLDAASPRTGGGGDHPAARGVQARAANSNPHAAGTAPARRRLTRRPAGRVLAPIRTRWS